ncbi:MAG: hypothetical protein QOJ27_1506 [Sphingomonadales bacterium]|nr:hypothetical protein [Sphingomonadales bacterium]
MDSRQVTKISYFEIIGENYRAAYSNRYDEPVQAGTYQNKIQDAVNNGKLPGDFPAKPDVPSKHPDRFLDIYESKTSAGVSAYAFRLNGVVDGRQRLRFADSGPFIKLPMNSSTHEDFLTDLRPYIGEDGRWASFVCDLDAVRSSELAKRIQSIAEREDPERRHARFLTIPFCLNVVDPELDAAPWVVPAEEDEEMEGDDRLRHEAKARFSARLRREIFTHGGVHPSAASFLSVEL